MGPGRGATMLKCQKSEAQSASPLPPQVSCWLEDAQAATTDRAGPPASSSWARSCCHPLNSQLSCTNPAFPDLNSAVAFRKLPSHHTGAQEAQPVPRPLPVAGLGHTALPGPGDSGQANPYTLGASLLGERLPWTGSLWVPPVQVAMWVQSHEGLVM